MVIIIMEIIERPELDKVLSDYGWLMLYGRRKTGKTFYVRERGSYDKYYIVSRGRSVIDVVGGEVYSVDEFLRIFRSILLTEKIVIDEFHRLGREFVDMLQALAGRGKLILLTSAMHLLTYVIRQPLTGLTELKRISLIDPRDTLRHYLAMGLKGRELFEAALIVREPWLIPLFHRYGLNLPYNFGDELRVYVPNLIGEIFNEEDIEYSLRYSGILGAVADGKVYSSEISSYLFSKGLIEKDNPGLISQYLKNLIGMGLLKAVPIWGLRRKRFYYRHVSPITDFSYYLDEKYAFYDVGLDNNTVGDIFRERLPRYMEWFIEDLLSAIYEYQPVKIILDNREVDIALRDHQKIRMVVEVKWKHSIDNQELSRVEDTLSSIDARRILFVPNRDVLPREPRDIEVWDWETIKNVIEINGYTE